MQRIAERIQKEFSSNESYIEVNALDGNGDSFRVYQGKPSELTGYNFANILRDPGCFYFFNITCLPDIEQPEAIIRRDLCWLTDPLSPTIQTSTSTSLVVEWNPVRFCGISYAEMINSITYTLEVAEGVDWKETALSRYMNDNIASSYRTLFKGKNISSAIIDRLKPAKWYHIRLIIDYLGLRVMSESASHHTMKSTPSVPSAPRVSVVPVKNSFDATSQVPSRLDVLISWNASVENGHEIERYQVHLKRFDVHGKVLLDDPPVLKKKHQGVPSHTQKNVAMLIKTSKQANQWIGSPGKSEIQIKNSLRSRSPSPTSGGRSRSPDLFASAGTLSQVDSQILQGNRRPQTWKIIYDNLNRSVKMFAPKESDGEWWIRVRAKNAEGWSGFSSICTINHFNFPSLFALPMLKEADNHEEYLQYFYPSNSGRSDVDGNSAVVNEQQDHHRSATSPQTIIPSILTSYNPSQSNSIKNQRTSVNSFEKYEVDVTKNEQQSFHFRAHHYENIDRLKDHQDEVGLFWDHKASETNPSSSHSLEPSNQHPAQTDERLNIRTSRSGDEYIIFPTQSGDTFDTQSNNSQRLGGRFPEIVRK